MKNGIGLARGKSFTRTIGVAGLLTAVLGAAGCSANFAFPASDPEYAGVGIQGRVIGGQNPVIGATIGLYTVGTTGYGSAGTSLLTKTVTSDGAGNFVITNDYTCPTKDTDVYLTAKGGNPGLTPAVNNSAIFLVAPLGLCSTLTADTKIIINEATTLAAGYALAQFTNFKKETIGASSGNAFGLQEAFATVNNLVNINTGVVLKTTPSANGANGIVPQGEIDTLADALAACVNSTGTGSEACQTLLPDVTPTTLQSTAPAKDIFQAALYLAQYPGTDIVDVMGLVTPQSPFQPILKIAPNDWTLGIQYSGGGISYPGSVLIDQLGNVWVLSAPLYGGSISKLSPVGKPISPTPQGFDTDAELGPAALDSSGNLWMASNSTELGTSGIIEFNSLGEEISPDTLEQIGYQPNSLLFPQGLAIDMDSNVWITNSGSIVVEIDKTGNLVSPSGTPTTTLLKGYQICLSNTAANGIGIAIDSNGSVWIANSGMDSLVEMQDPGGGLLSPDAGWTGGGLDGQDNTLNGPINVAVDGQGFVWTTNGNGTASEFVGTVPEGGTPSSAGPTGTPLSPSGGYYGTGGLSYPSGIAVDGAGNIWFTNPNQNSVTELSQSAFAVSPGDGYGEAGFNGPAGIAIDPSGNVWVANFGTGFNGTVTEMIGAAGPTVTPLTPSMIGSMP